MIRNNLKPTLTTVGRRIRAARMQADMTQDQLGVAIGLDEGNACIRISRYESGQVTPPLPELEHLAVALQVPVAFLVSDDDSVAAINLELARLKPQVLEALRKRIAKL